MKNNSLKSKLMLSLLGMFSLSLNAQVKIGENPTTINSSAMLQIDVSQTSGSSKGFLLPRVPLTSLTDAITIASPATGLVVYATGGALAAGLYTWNGTAWVTYDATNDAWVNNPTNTRVELGTTSTGATRTTGTEFVARDNGNVGIGTNNPDDGAILELKSSDKGLLMPRVALQAANVWSLQGNPTAGMVVYNTANAGTAQNKVIANTFYFWNGSSWNLFTSNNNPLTTVTTYGYQSSAAQGTFAANTQCYCQTSCEQNLNWEHTFTVYKNSNTVDVSIIGQLILHGSTSDGTFCVKVYNSANQQVGNGAIYQSFSGINGCMGQTISGRALVVNNLATGNYTVKVTLSMRNYSSNLLHWGVGTNLSSYPSCGTANSTGAQILSVSVTE